MKILINAEKLTDSPYTQENKAAFLFDDEVLLEQFTLELHHGHAAAYLISGYRGSGKTSFINRLRERMSNVVFVELNVAKPVSYPILVKRVIRQLFLQYQAHREDSEKEPDEFMEEFQLLYDRTFNDIVSSGVLSHKKEKKIEQQQKFDIQKVIEILWKLIGPLLISLLSILAIAVKVAPFYLMLGTLVVSVIWGAISALTVSWTTTQTDSESAEITRKSLYDDEIAEHHLFQMLQKLNKAGNKMVVVFDELDKLAEDKSVRDMVNDIKPLLLSGYASFLVVAGQALYYDLERSTFLDDNVITTLFARTFHVAFLKDSTLQKYCLALFKNDNDKRDLLATDFFDNLIIRSGRNPRKLVNLIRGHIGWDNEQAFIILDEGKRDRFRWLSKVHQEVAYVVDNSLASQMSDRVRQDFFIAQTFIWLSKMLTYDSVSFKKHDVWAEKSYDEKYPGSWVLDLTMVWNTLIEALVNARLLNVSQSDPEQSAEYSWIYLEIPLTEIDRAPGGEEEEEEEEEVDEDDDIEGIGPYEANTRGGYIDTDAISGAETNRKTFVTDHGHQSRFLIEFSQFENYLRNILDAETSGEQNLNIAFRTILDTLVRLTVLELNWTQSSAVVMVNGIRNRVAHGQNSGKNDQQEIEKAYSLLPQLWSEVNEQYTLYILKRLLINVHAERTTEGGFDIIGALPGKRLALEIKTYRETSPDTRVIIQAVDKYQNYTAKTTEELLYGLLIFQNAPSKDNESKFGYLNKILGQIEPAKRQLVHFNYIDMNDPSGLAAQIKNALREILDSEINKVP